ncbi:MAG: hypothetical protein A2Y12_07740 [Planctomycetes bacterium GWF2_42_9]|nr:MAG: hypothetical protein A2Y12_07740 [Planctomycetes bacterium GWF2_42_9]
MKKAISVLCVVLLATVCFAADKVDLKLRLKAGDSHEMKMVQVQDITQNMSGMEMKVKQTQEMVMTLDCTGVDANGNMDLKMGYKSVKMSMEGPMGKMAYDSDNPNTIGPNSPPQDKMMAGLFSAMVGSQFQMKVKPTGEVTSMTGLSDMMQKVKEKLKATPEAAAAEGVLDKMFDEKQMKELTGNMMNMYPAEPIAVGDSWYDIKSINFMMPIDIDTTYMLKSVKDDTAIIDTVAKLDMGDPNKPIVSDPNMKMSMQMAGTINGTNEVDLKNGLTKNGDMTMNFSGIMKMEGNPQMPEGMTIPMSIKGTATVELTK